VARPAGSTGSATRGRIFLSAVRLFSERGYNGVSVRDIARAVGIKESSLYNHFESKDAIISEIYSVFRERLLSRKITPEAVDALLDTMPAERYFSEAFARYADSMTNAFAVKTWRILVSEQFRDPRAQALYNEDIRRKLHDDTKLVLSRMQARGLIRDVDLEAAAAALVEGIKGMLFRFIGSAPRGKKEFLEAVDRHISFFWEGIRSPVSGSQGGRRTHAGPGSGR
jgi:AcrR family transcriptional regulator